MRRTEPSDDEQGDEGPVLGGRVATGRALAIRLHLRQLEVPKLRKRRNIELKSRSASADCRAQLSHECFYMLSTLRSLPTVRGYLRRFHLAI